MGTNLIKVRDRCPVCSRGATTLTTLATRGCNVLRDNNDSFRNAGGPRVSVNDNGKGLHIPCRFFRGLGYTRGAYGWLRILLLCVRGEVIL